MVGTEVQLLCGRRRVRGGGMLRSRGSLSAGSQFPFLVLGSASATLLGQARQVGSSLPGSGVCVCLGTPFFFPDEREDPFGCGAAS